MTRNATLRAYLDFAVETAYQAGRMTLGYFQAGVQPDFKADDSPVTVADRKTEEFIRAKIEMVARSGASRSTIPIPYTINRPNKKSPR